MYTVNKGPSKIVAKTRRGLPQNFEKFESIKESGKKHGSISNNFDLNSPEKNKKSYDSSTVKLDGKADANNNSASTLATPSPVDSIIANTPVSASAAPAVWVEPPSPALNDFKPFDLESWWGRRLFHNITKSL
ncbi:PREDICTED: uncharacterized protein LOC108620327 [Drosophila arizonae]|uniref:Uncharacterized protein LOC108620327 n=1 Tax=Drosophila arizonae TaxID=7263 RepID=A0ABM1PZT5_DROAR|nr:PREDICTED: uncharacterized protein LOC108620327 [Drosophila arizonae]